MTDIMTVIIILLLIVCVILLVLVLLRQAKLSNDRRSEAIREELMKLRERVDADARSDADARTNLRREISETMNTMADRQEKSLRDMADRQDENLHDMADRQLDSLHDMSDRQNESLRDMSARQNRQLSEISDKQNEQLREISDKQNRQLSEISDKQNEQMRVISDKQNEQMRAISDKQNETLREMSEREQQMLQKIVEENARQKEAIIETLTTSIEKLQTSNENKLNEMQGIVDRKLDKTLNERLDTNFSKVTEQLGNLYRSLGELKDLSGGVADLNRTLSNVKTRGTWGEVQLQRILEQTLPRNQYDVNVATKRNSTDRVEFAIKFPAQDGSDELVYLPIDAKFPSDIYNRISEAADNNDQEALSAAKNELKNRIRGEASSISSKYLDPPRTTNYAFMYLPTEGLYAEVLRIDGLTEECQKKGVVITGPTTITAVLNALQVGFRNVALSKKSVEVMKLLEAVKGQVSRMDDAVVKTQKKLSDAVSMTDDLQKRTSRLTSRMRAIGEMDEAESDRLLGLDDMMGLPENETDEE